MKRVFAIFVACAAATLCLAPSATAQDTWQFRMTPYVWAMSTAGDGQLGPVPVNLDASTKEIVKGLDFSLEGYIEATKGGLLLLADTHISKVHINIAPAAPLTAGKFTNRMVIVSAAAGRRFKGRYDLYAGVRYYNLNLQALFDGFPFFFGGQNAWVDPIVGARVLVPLKPKMAFALRGDVGGFGVGSSVAWMIQPTVTYQVSPKLNALIGFRILKANRETGRSVTDFNKNLFDYDVSHRGPGFGMTLSF
jgi:hypothetical protein